MYLHLVATTTAIGAMFASPFNSDAPVRKLVFLAAIPAIPVLFAFLYTTHERTITNLRAFIKECEAFGNPLVPDPTGEGAPSKRRIPSYHASEYYARSRQFRYNNEYAAILLIAVHWAPCVVGTIRVVQAAGGPYTPLGVEGPYYWAAGLCAWQTIWSMGAMYAVWSAGQDWWGAPRTGQ